MVHFGDLSWTGKRIDRVTRNGGNVYSPRGKMGLGNSRTGSDGDTLFNINTNRSTIIRFNWL